MLGVAKVGLLAVVLAVAGFGASLNRAPASAATGTSIVVAMATSDPQNPCPSPPVQALTYVVSMQNAPPVELCVWAKNVKDPQGVGSFQLGFSYNSQMLTVNSITASTVWLGSTGRTALCSPVYNEPQYGLANVGCSTINVPPPYGPQGTGYLGRFAIQPGMTTGLTPINLANETYLDDTGYVQGTTVFPPQEISASVTGVNYRVARCADFTGDNKVRIPDISAIISKYGTVSPPHDLDDSGRVLSPDIVIGVLEYGRDCPQL
jgi:hypothetical protein